MLLMISVVKKLFEHFMKKNYKRLINKNLGMFFSQRFPKPCEPFGGDINARVDLSDYAVKTYIKNISHVVTSSFALKSNLASLNTEVVKLVIDKLLPVPIDLSKVM